MVSGMSIGTLFTLFVLPAVYVWMATDHQANASSQRTNGVFQSGDVGAQASVIS